MRYEYFTRASKKVASTAFLQGNVIRVSELKVNPVTHQSYVIGKTICKEHGKTLHDATMNVFGIHHGQKDRFLYEVRK